MRWPVEIIFEESKGELGFDHYETRLYTPQNKATIQYLSALAASAQARRPMSLTFHNLFRLLFGFILLQAKGLSPGNADVLVVLDLPRHISCRRGRQRSQGNKVAEPSRLRRARCPRSFEGSNRRERGRPARMKDEGHFCPSLCCRYEKLVALGKMPMLPVRGRPCQRSTGFPTRGATDKKVRSPLPCLQKGARASRPMTLTFQGASRF